jgi:CheY-like chemotaxis protein
MASILIVEEDGVLARQMARTLRQAGHRPTLVSAVDAALCEVEAQPDVILLDLEVAELPQAALLDRLPRRPETARIPVLAITGRYEAALRLREAGRVAAVLRKPVSGVHLREAVDRLVGPHGSLNSEVQRWERQRQGELILHLLVKGSDPLVFQIAQRICADRTYAPPTDRAMALTWADIADWGRREGLLEAEQAHLLCRIPLARALRAQAHAA